jgi:hypothetical protein
MVASAVAASGVAAAAPSLHSHHHARHGRKANAAAVPSAVSSVSSSSSSARLQRRRNATVAAAARPSVAFVDVVDDATEDAGTTLKPFLDGMQKVTLFGVSHMTNSYEAAEHILRTKPRSVVVRLLHSLPGGVTRLVTYSVLFTIRPLGLHSLPGDVRVFAWTMLGVVDWMRFGCK